MADITINGLEQDLKAKKWFSNLEYDMKDILPYINDPKVTDIAIGKGGELIVEGSGMDKLYTGIFFDDIKTIRIINAAAAVMKIDIDPDNPIVEGVLPNWKLRIEGVLPPRAGSCPMLFLRRPSSRIFTLENYLENKQITQAYYDLLIEHIKKRSNILIGGETGSGKTTFLNAVIAKMVEFTPDDRFFIVEDAGELQCRAKDVVPIWAEGEDCVKAVRIALRCNVNRIIFGELRLGSVVNEVLKAWNTGHSGNCSTVHCDSCLSMIARIRDLLREVIAGELPDISQSVQLLVHLTPTGTIPIVDEVVETKSFANSSFIENMEANNLLP